MDPSPLDLLVLHGLRLKGFAEATVLAGFLGRSVAEIEAVLNPAAEAGYVRFRTGERSGWSLTTEGRKENERLLAVELDAAGLRADLESRYRAFLPLNAEMLAVCTDWQVKDRAANALNDHTDPSYDAGVLDRLADIHAAIGPICAELGSRIERFAGYGPRFVRAFEKIEAGELDWFTKPTIDSYHTVWFELHEDLLVTLGIDRASERA